MVDPPLISHTANRSDINLNNPILANILPPNFNERFLSILTDRVDGADIPSLLHVEIYLALSKQASTQAVALTLQKVLHQGYDFKERTTTKIRRCDYLTWKEQRLRLLLHAYLNLTKEGATGLVLSVVPA